MLSQADGCVRADCSVAVVGPAVENARLPCPKNMFPGFECFFWTGQIVRYRGYNQGFVVLCLFKLWHFFFCLFFFCISDAHVILLFCLQLTAPVQLVVWTDSSLK